ncbi:Spermatogenesis-associated protein 31A1 [Sciurus carolinensis]|uniref:Spermatogenesis-associated protein 31A1 n=1 Tax=Sciurus carolinensis TaxID=30640 RepID=A0AA41T4M0_SCICA|nr:Spermatogenesis-associated protein 31A1 [Sciurus carolinensis]
MALPLGAITRRPALPEHVLASPIPAISSLGHSSSAVPALPWWPLAARALSLATSSDSESQKEPPSHPPPRAASSGDATSPSFCSSGDQNILGIKVTGKVEIKIWKEKEKDGSFLEQMGPGYRLSSWRDVLNSLAAKQDPSARPFWEMKDKAQQLLGPQPLSCSKALGDHFQQKYNQLFWGLPSLHSESLVAAAWIPGGTSAPQPASFLFNGISSVCPVPVQDPMSALLSQSHLGPQAPPLLLSIPQFRPPALGQFQTGAHLQPSLQALPPSSPPHVTDCAPQSKPQALLPAGLPHAEMPWLGKHLGRGWALPAVVQRSQDVYNILTPHLCQDSCADAILPENLPVSPELREQLEQHIQRWLIERQWDQMQEPLELMQLRDELAETCQTKDKPCPSRSSLSGGECIKETQKVRFQLGKDAGKNLGHILGKVPKDPSRDLEVFPGKVQQTSPLDSLRNLTRLLKRHSENDEDQSHLGSTLKAHLCLKSEQIQEGMIPWSVYQSWLSLHSALFMSDANRETRAPVTSESWETCMATCRRLPFLDPDTQQVLEEHIVKLWVKHRWGLPLKVLKPTNLLKKTASQHMPLPELAGPSSSPQVSGDNLKVEVAKILGKPPQPCLRGKVPTDESVPTLGQPFLRGRVPTDESVPTLGQPFLRGKVPTDESVPTLGQPRLRGKVPTDESVPTLGQPRLRGKVPTDESVPTLASLLLISSLAGKEIERALTGIPPTQDHRPPAAPPAVQESRQPSQTLSHSLLDRTLQSRTVLGTGKSSLKAPSLPRTSAARFLEEPCLQPEDAGEFQQTVEIKVVNQPPVSAPDVSLPDCSTNTLSAADSLASPVSWSPLQSKPFGKTPVSPTLVNLLAARRSSLMPQKPRVLKHQHLQRPQRELYTPAYRGEDRRRPSSGQHKEMEELGTCKLPQARGLEEKKQEPSEGFFRRTWRRFLQWLFPKKKIKEQEEALKTCRPPSASAQSAAPIRATPSVDSNITEARELLTAVGQMLEKKMALHHKCCASKLKQPREEHPGPAPQAPCYHRPPVCPRQRGLSGYAAAPKGRSCPIRERPDRSQQSLKSVHFNSQQWGQRHPHPWLSKKAVSPVSPSQHGPAVPGPSGHHRPCPRHRLHQGGVLSAQQASFSPVSSGRKTRP